MYCDHSGLYGSYSSYCVSRVVGKVATKRSYLSALVHPVYTFFYSDPIV